MSFLEKLFDVIKTQAYLKSDAEPAENASVTSNNKPNEDAVRESTPPLKQTKSDETVLVQDPTQQQLTDVQQKTDKLSPTASKESLKESPNSKKSLVANNKSKSQEPISVRNNDVAKDSRRRRISNRSRSRSRSRSKSFERARRSRSRDRHVREKNPRQFRNVSPPPSNFNNQRRYEHRKNDRGSPKNYEARRQQMRHRSLSRSRSNSPEYMGRGIGVGVRAAGSPKVDGERKRCRDFDEKGYCMRGETCPWDHGVDPVVLEDINNPSLLGLSNVSSVGLRAPLHSEYNPDAPDLWNRNPRFGPGPNSGGFGMNPMLGHGGRNVLPVPAPRPPFNLRGPYPFPPGMGGIVPPQLPRELIPVPVMDASGQPAVLDSLNNQVKRRFEADNDPQMAMMEVPAKRKLANRLGPRVGPGGINSGSMGANSVPQQNCSLELRKIPRGLNAISHLNNHFSKFGKIVNIQVSYDNDPEAAIVTFSTHAEANVAYRSTEAVLNNRFIKVFWHPGSGADGSNANKSENNPVPGNMSLRRTYTNPNPYQTNNVSSSVSSSVNTSTSLTTTISTASNNSQPNSDSTNNPDASTSNANTLTTTTTTQSAIAPIPSSKSTTYFSPATKEQQQQKQAAIASNQLRLKTARATTELIRKKQEEQTKTAVQLAHGLQEKKHELLQKYLKQMRSIVELAEKTDSDAQRHKYMETIKVLQLSIDRMRKEISTEQVNIASKMNPAVSARKTKEQQQKELLDVELDLISKEQHGETDTAAIQKQLKELQKSLARAQSFFPTPRQRPVVRAAVAPPGSTSVDRRPTTVCITGFVLEDSDAVLGHFKVSFPSIFVRYSF